MMILLKGEGCFFFLIGSCNGLLCLYIKEMDNKRYKDDLMYLWNPITKESREIVLPVGGISTYVHVDSCWFGFVDSLDDYKILLVSTVYKPYQERYMYFYSLRNDSWRRIAVSGSDLFSISLCNSVFMGDALHYLVRRQCILKFNLVTETFERIPLSIVPELFPSVDEMVLGVIEEYDCLCVTFVHRAKRRYEVYPEEDFEESSEEDEEEGSEEEDEWMLEVWTLEEYNKWDSWKKWYRIELEEEIAGRCIQFLGFTYTGIIVCRAVEDDGLVVCDPSWNPPPYVVVRNSCSKVYNMNTYVESLVSPFSPFSPFPLEEDEDEEEEEEGEEEEEEEEEEED